MCDREEILHRGDDATMPAGRGWVRIAIRISARVNFRTAKLISTIHYIAKRYLSSNVRYLSSNACACVHIRETY